MGNFMRARNTFETSTREALEKVRTGAKAYLSEDPILYYAHQRRPCNTHVIRNLLEAKSYGLILQRQSEWTNPISVEILNLRERGFLSQISNDWWEKRSECRVETYVKSAGKPIPLRLSSLSGVYV